MSRFKINSYPTRLTIAAYVSNLISFILHTPAPKRIAAAAIIKSGEKFLVLDLSYRNGFSLSGGVLEKNENLEEGLAREVMEETGLTVTNTKYITSNTEVQFGTPVIVVAFLVETTGELRASAEGTLHWKTPEEILGSMVYQNSKEVFLTYLKQANYACARG